MKDTDFKKSLDDLVKFQRLLKEGVSYDVAYYRTYNRWHEDYLREQAKEFIGLPNKVADYEKKVIVGTINPNLDGVADDRFVDEPKQCKH